MGKRIDELTQRTAVAGDDSLPMESADAFNYKAQVSQIGGYAVPGTCDTAGSTQQKVVTLTDYTGTAIPTSILIQFDHKNEYGDCTLSTPTFPQLVIMNDAEEPAILATLDVCDSRGHTAGKGCWNDGDFIEFRVLLNSQNTGYAFIKNSDVRQADSNMTIKADGSNVYRKEINSTTGTVQYNGWYYSTELIENTDNIRVISMGILSTFENHPSMCQPVFEGGNFRIRFYSTFASRAVSAYVEYEVI